MKKRTLLSWSTGKDSAWSLHNIVVDGPMFDTRIDVEIGETVQRDGFAFADIIPAD